MFIVNAVLLTVANYRCDNAANTWTIQVHMYKACKANGTLILQHWYANINPLDHHACALSLAFYALPGSARMQEEEEEEEAEDDG